LVGLWAAFLARIILVAKARYMIVLKIRKMKNKRT
jgi:hypothetical protein